MLKQLAVRQSEARWLPAFLLIFFALGCEPKQNDTTAVPMPTKVIDLGAIVTEDLPEQVWGRRVLSERDWMQQNSFDIRRWEYGPVRGSNSFYTLFNHGGPHIDAPNHVGLPGGIDSYRVDAFVGPLKVFDASQSPFGRTVAKDTFENADLLPGDIVLIYTGYGPPANDDEYPRTITLTTEAAEYLADIPVGAFGTDALSVAVSGDDVPKALPDDPIEAVPVHHAFLSKNIPVYEQLFNVDLLLGEKKMIFIGQPLNIKDGDGMMVRPLVLVY